VPYEVEEYVRKLPMFLNYLSQIYEFKTAIVAPAIKKEIFSA
jgi:hypothetical protein